MKFSLLCQNGQFLSNKLSQIKFLNFLIPQVFLNSSVTLANFPYISNIIFHLLVACFEKISLTSHFRTLQGNKLGKVNILGNFMNKAFANLVKMRKFLPTKISSLILFD